MNLKQYVPEFYAIRKTVKYFLLVVVSVRWLIRSYGQRDWGAPPNLKPSSFLTGSLDTPGPPMLEELVGKAFAALPKAVKI